MALRIFILLCLCCVAVGPAYAQEPTPTPGAHVEALTIPSGRAVYVVYTYTLGEIITTGAILALAVMQFVNLVYTYTHSAWAPQTITIEKKDRA